MTFYFSHFFWLQVLSIEVNHSDRHHIDNFMKQRGYILKHKFPPPPSTVQDHIYVLNEELNGN